MRGRTSETPPQRNQQSLKYQNIPSESTHSEWEWEWEWGGLTFVPLQFVFGHSVRAAVKVFLQRVHLPAQDVPEGLHLCQLLPQAVAFLEEQHDDKGGGGGGVQRSRAESSPVCVLSRSRKLTTKAHLEGGGGGGGVAAGGRGEGQHGAVSPQAGLGSISGISLRGETELKNETKSHAKLFLSSFHTCTRSGLGNKIRRHANPITMATQPTSGNPDRSPPPLT